MTEPVSTEGDAPTPVTQAPASPSAVAGLWERIKHRKMVHWLAAYAAAAYTLLHGVEMISGGLTWPHLVVSLTTALVLLGAPVAAIIAWYHGERGLQRVSGMELAIFTVLAIIAGSVLWSMTRSGGEPTATGTNGAAGVATQAAPTASSATAAAPQAVTASAPRTAVAVLPFANLTGDASKEYLGDGMAEAMINTLTKVPGLKVPARTSTFAYKGRGTDIRQIAKDLGVGTILEGSVQAAGKRLRITAQLINAQDGLHLWSETYNEEFTDIFKLQDKLANAIALALEPKLADAGASPVTPTRPTQDVEAYNLYLQGWSLVDRPSLENEQRAITYFNQALARDPNFAQAHAGIAEAYMAMAFVGGTQRLEFYAAAEQAARRALALDASLAYPHLALGGVAAARGQILEGEAHSRAALSLAPNDGYVQIAIGAERAAVGRLKDSLEAGQRAYALAPANPPAVANYAWINALAGRDAEASRYAAAAIDLGYPKDSSPLPTVGELAALRSGQYAEAAALNAKASNDSRIAESARLAYGALEHPAQRAAALTAIARLFAAAPTQSGADTDYVRACMDGVHWMAIVGGLDEAFALANRCLTRAGAGMDFDMTNAAQYLFTPEMRPFRRDARFHAFITRLGLMEYYQQYGPPDDCELKNNKLTCH